jgi:5'-nucleotidase
VLQSLGNHEFDDGVDGLVPFINNATFPFVASNLDLSKETRLNIPNLKKSVVFDLDGVKVAVIGYVTPDTKVRDYWVTKVERLALILMPLNEHTSN